MKKLLAKLDSAGRLAENTALVVLLATMVLLSVLQIVNRQFFSGGLAISWADELIKIIVLWLAMVGSIAACRDGKHIRIDLISHVLSGPVITGTRILVDTFAAGVCAFIGYQAWRLVSLEREWGDMAAIDVPLWALHAVVPAAFILISYRFLVDVAKNINRLIAGETDEVTP